MFGSLMERGIQWYIDPVNDKPDELAEGWMEFLGDDGEFLETSNPGNWVGLTLASVYFIMPADLIPDWIPVIGYADDVIVLKYGWNIGGAIWEVGSWIAEAFD